MGGLRTPKSAKGAERLCELFAENAGRIEASEAARNAAIARINAKYDAELEKPLGENAQIREKLEPWFLAEGKALLEEPKKSLELGGCIIGTRVGKVSLAIEGKPGEVARALVAKGHDDLTRTSLSIDKRACLKALEGDMAKDLAGLGLAIAPAPEDFVLERAEQRLTRGRK